MLDELEPRVVLVYGAMPIQYKIYYRNEAEARKAAENQDYCLQKDNAKKIMKCKLSRIICYGQTVNVTLKRGGWIILACN